MNGIARFRPRCEALLVIAAASFLATSAAAQKTYAIPESPAFTYLEVTPASVSRPSSARAFGTAVLDGISPNGEVKQGIALDVAPWTYLPGVTVTLPEYQRDRWAYILANAQLSLATARSAGDSADTDLALGLRLTLLDQTDPMRDTAYTNELRRRMATGCPISDDFNADLAEQRTCLGKVTSGWREEWKRERSRWNGTSLGLAFAGGWRFDESVVRNSEWRGLSTWATGGVPVGTFGLLLGQLRYDLQEDGGSSGLAYGARAFVGTRIVNGFFELVGDHRGEASGEVNWTSGLEFRAAENMWLSTGFGSRAVPGSSEQRTVVIADLRWNIADAPRLVSGR
ncbi:MAG TPA: hypothetical protein VGX50_20765 [Longimicrobium sp.]|jgi:hypothetical protein|nr:hypothetical protein [Longimicrobium sp.]